MFKWHDRSRGKRRGINFTVERHTLKSVSRTVN